MHSPAIVRAKLVTIPLLAERQTRWRGGRRSTPDKFLGRSRSSCTGRKAGRSEVLRNTRLTLRGGRSKKIKPLINNVQPKSGTTTASALADQKLCANTIARPASKAMTQAKNRSGASWTSAVTVSTVACLCEIMVTARKRQVRPVSSPRKIVRGDIMSSSPSTALIPKQTRRTHDSQSGFLLARSSRTQTPRGGRR